jgi:hypothetical protein
MPQMKVLKELDVAGLQRELTAGSRIDGRSGCLFICGFSVGTDIRQPG